MAEQDTMELEQPQLPPQVEQDKVLPEEAPEKFNIELVLDQLALISGEIERYVTYSRRNGHHSVALSLLDLESSISGVQRKVSDVRILEMLKGADI